MHRCGSTVMLALNLTATTVPALMPTAMTLAAGVVVPAVVPVFQRSWSVILVPRLMLGGHGTPVQ